MPPGTKAGRWARRLDESYNCLHKGKAGKYEQEATEGYSKPPSRTVNGALRVFWGRM